MTTTKEEGARKGVIIRTIHGSPQGAGKPPREIHVQPGGRSVHLWLGPTLARNVWMGPAAARLLADVLIDAAAEAEAEWERRFAEREERS